MGYNLLINGGFIEVPTIVINHSDYEPIMASQLIPPP